MRFQAKAFASLLLSLAFLGLSFSGVLLFFTPRGRVANWTGWTMLGLNKQGWAAVHVNLGILAVIVAAVHLIFNWSMFWGYIKKKTSFALNLKLEIIAAALIAAVVLAGAVYEVPPFSAVMALNQQIKDSWEGEASDSPAPHAEEFSLERLAVSLHLSVSQVVEALREEGFTVADATATVGQVAEANGVTPRDLHAALTKRFPEASRGGPGKGQGPGRGMGEGMGKGMGGGWRSHAKADE